ncbi:MAG: aminoglycoside/choline kinase family phosphotransferase [Myxococcota bacterium]|jgi:aminoglycoside/choline kinase family phosphotransferase
MNSTLQRGFESLTGRTAQHIVEMAGGASSRRYYRVADGQSRFVVMQLADEPVRAAEGTAQVPAGTFMEMATLLEDGGVDVPKIHRHDAEARQLWLEDLGDITLLKALQSGGDRVVWYRRAIDALTTFQVATRSAASSATCRKRRFGRDQIIWELEHYVEWRIEHQLKRVPSEAWRTAIRSEFDSLADALLSLPQRISHRDFQSTNLMVTDDRLVLIDFQDAWVAPDVYDLVALLRDSYVALDTDELSELLAYYAQGHESQAQFDEAQFRRGFALQTAQRKLKDAGRFVFFDHNGNSSYLEFVEPTLAYVHEALTTLPELDRLTQLLADVDPEFQCKR